MRSSAVTSRIAQTALPPQLRQLPAGSDRSLLFAALRLWPVSNEKISLEYKLKRLLQGSLMPPERAHVYWNGTFSDAEKATLLRIPAAGRAHRCSRSVLEQAFPGDGVAPFLEFDQEYYLAG